MTTTIPVTRMLSEWAAGLAFEDIPAKTVTCATEQVVGIIAAIYASSRTDICKPLYSAIASWGDREESTVVGAGLKTSMRHAGMANAFAAQTLEWEDRQGLHPQPPVHKLVPQPPDRHRPHGR